MDYDKYQERIVNGIVAELVKPQNLDLLIAVRDHGLDDGGSFMWTFKSGEGMTFDEFALLTPQIDALIKYINPEAPEDYRTTSTRFDEYLAILNDHSRINLDQTKRFNAILYPFDDEWSGAMYGMFMRNVQMIIRRTFQN